jgi:hypothetical protein
MLLRHSETTAHAHGVSSQTGAWTLVTEEDRSTVFTGARHHQSPVSPKTVARKRDPPEPSDGWQGECLVTGKRGPAAPGGFERANARHADGFERAACRWLRARGMQMASSARAGGFQGLEARERGERWVRGAGLNNARRRSVVRWFGYRLWAHRLRRSATAEGAPHEMDWSDRFGWYRPQSCCRLLDGGRTRAASKSPALPADRAVRGRRSLGQ